MDPQSTEVSTDLIGLPSDSLRAARQWCDGTNEAMELATSMGTQWARE